MNGPSQKLPHSHLILSAHQSLLYADSLKTEDALCGALNTRNESKVGDNAESMESANHHASLAEHFCACQTRKVKPTEFLEGRQIVCRASDRPWRTAFRAMR